jgi:hypothetical protein
MKRRLAQDQWTAVACLAIAVLFILAIPSQTSDRPLPGARGFNVLDGAFFPRIAVALFVIAAIWLFFEARPPSGSGEADTDDQPPGMTLRGLFGSLALSGGILVYVQFLHPVGFLLSTIIGVSLLAFVCGQRSWLGFLLGGIVFPAVIFYLFSKLFMVPLPRGLFPIG